MTDGGGRESLAPVIPIFGGPPARAPEGAAPRPAEPAWHSTWSDDGDDLYGEADLYGGDGYDACGEIERELAEKNLLKRLRTRSLSVCEARAVVAERDLDDGTIDAVIASFTRLGYLDDGDLAEQLVHTATSRKGEGRRAIAQTLAKRGIPREVADAALAALPDDDLERALEFARSKARSMTSLDREVALRRLSGQLTRRGYSGSIALDAARRALDESGSGPASVRFR